MSKILIFCDDLVPPFSHSPQALRCQQLFLGLRANNYEVILSLPDFGKKICQELDEQARQNLWRVGNQDEILKRHSPDCVIFSSSWEHMLLNLEPEIPLVLDLFGSRILNPISDVHCPSIRHKLEALNLADMIITGNKAQMLYFSGWLVQAGRMPGEDIQQHIIPPLFPVEKIRRPEVDNKNFPHLVFDEGWLPRHVLDIFNFLDGRGRITLLGEPGTERDGSSEEQRIFEDYRKVARIAENSGRISFQSATDVNSINKILAGADIGVKSYVADIQHSLQPSFQSSYFLSSGIPLIVDEGDSVAALVDRKQLGWLVNFEKVNDLKQVVKEIIDSPRSFISMAHETSRYAGTYMTYKESLEPIRKYLEKDSCNLLEGSKIEDHAFGSAVSRSSFMNAMSLSPSGWASFPVNGIKQYFLLPEDHVAELRFILDKKDTLEPGAQMRTIIKNSSGKILINEMHELDELDKGIHLLSLPLRKSVVHGGEKLLLEIKPFFDGSEALDVDSKLKRLSSCIYLRFIEGPGFPLLVDNARNFDSGAATEDINWHYNMCLALEFLPGRESMLSRARTLTSRAVGMLKRGEWGRVVRAAKWRISMAVTSK